MDEELDLLIFYVPMADTDEVLEAVFAAGAGVIDDYDHCAFVVHGVGEFRPRKGADPAIGEVGNIEMVAENRVEVTIPRSRRAAIVAALKQAHPYETVGYHVVETHVV